MAKYKRLRSVAHNLGHSFLSDSNALGDPYTYVPRVLYSRARELRVPRLKVDFFAASMEPPELLTPLIQRSLEWYQAQLPRLIESQGVSITSVESAVLDLTLDVDSPPIKGKFDFEEPPFFECVVTIIDDQGRRWIGEPVQWMA